MLLHVITTEYKEGITEGERESKSNIERAREKGENMEGGAKKEKERAKANEMEQKEGKREQKLARWSKMRRENEREII